MYHIPTCKTNVDCTIRYNRAQHDVRLNVNFWFCCAFFSVDLTEVLSNHCQIHITQNTKYTYTKYINKSNTDVFKFAFRPPVSYHHSHEPTPPSQHPFLLTHSILKLILSNKQMIRPYDKSLQEERDEFDTAYHALKFGFMSTIFGN